MAWPATEIATAWPETLEVGDSAGSSELELGGQNQIWGHAEWIANYPLPPRPCLSGRTGMVAGCSTRISALLWVSETGYKRLWQLVVLPGQSCDFQQYDRHNDGSKAPHLLGCGGDLEWYRTGKSVPEQHWKVQKRRQSFESSWFQIHSGIVKLR